jgi:hypothetical protein
MSMIFDCTNAGLRFYVAAYRGQMTFHQERGMFCAPTPPKIKKDDYIFLARKDTAGELTPYLMIAESDPHDDAGDVNQGYRDWSTITWKIRLYDPQSYVNMSDAFRAQFLDFAAKHNVRQRAEQYFPR